jgi:PAS domain S-box-containing protein
MYLKKELYAKIQSDESIFDFIQESVLDGLWYWDLENPEIEWMNARFWKVLGYNPDEMPHKSATWQGIINQDDLKLASDNFTRHCENPNHPYDQIVRYTHKNGSTVWMRCRGIAIRDNTGKPIRMLGAHQDVTELKKSEQECCKANEKIHEREEKYRAMYNNAPLSYQSLDENGCFIDINPMWLKTLGYEKDEVIGKWYGDFLHPDYVEHFRINFPAFKNRGYVSDVQFKLRRKDNTYIYVSFEGCVGYTPEGKFKQTYCVFKDITEQKVLENALIKAKEKAEENEHTFRKLFEDSADGNLLIDSTGVFVECNQAALNFLQVSRELFSLKTPVKISPEFQPNGRKSEEAASEMIELAYKNGLHRFDWTHINTKGEEFIVEVSLMPILVKGQTMLHTAWRDITERKQNEIELQKAKQKAEESEEKFRKSIEFSPVAMAVANINGDLLFLNNQFVDTFGYTMEEIVSIPKWCELVYPDSEYRNSVITQWSNDVEFAIKNNIPTPARDCFVTCKNGDVKTIENTVFIEKEISIGLFQDITGRKQAEKELILAKDEAIENEQKYRMLFDSNRDSISLLGIGADGRPSDFIEFNHAACEMFGFTREELMQKKLEELEAPVAENVMIQRLKTLQSKGIVEFETIIRNKAGNGIDVEVKVIPINYQNQPALMNITRDITARKKAEQELIKAKEKAENNNRINEARLKLLKFSENHTIDEILEETLNTAEIISYSKIGFFHFVEQDQNNLSLQNWSTGTKKHYCNALGKGLHYPIEKAGVWVDCVFTRKPVIHNNYETLQHKKGLPVGHAPLFRELVVPIIYDDEVKAIFGIGNKETDYNQIDVENISLLAYLAWEIVEKKKISEALVFAKEKAEESDRLKSAFLANMSHEIRTPMNGILGFAELLKEPGLTGDEQQNYIEIIKKSGARMLNIINDIVDISKVEAGLMKLDINKSNVNEQIEYIYTFFKPEVEAKGMKFTFRNTLTAKEAFITTDREKLYAILTNLVKNAIKYTKKGSIEFGYSIETGHAIEARPALSLQFYVKDTGIGIPKNRQEAIFERFIQADIEDRMARQGAGLGLAITKAYIEMLGGKIWVESEEGIGSTFYFTLPYNTGQTAETIDHKLTPSEQNNNVRKLKVLIAEDDEVSAMLADSFIKIFCKEVLKARTGYDSVKACRENPDIDLVLMDIQMPEMGGCEATQQIRKFNKELIIIAQTAYGLSGDREKAIEAGCNDYLSKPISKDKLLALIHKYFKK